MMLKNFMFYLSISFLFSLTLVEEGDAFAMCTYIYNKAPGVSISITSTTSTSGDHFSTGIQTRSHRQCWHGQSIEALVTVYTTYSDRTPAIFCGKEWVVSKHGWLAVYVYDFKKLKHPYHSWVLRIVNYNQDGKIIDNDHYPCKTFKGGVRCLDATTSNSCDVVA